MTDLEEIGGPSESLDAVLKEWATREYENALTSGDERKYFVDALKDTAKGFKVPHSVAHSIIHNVLDFATERYIFHRRHKELDKIDAKRETIIDTFKYMLELKNEYTLVDKPRMRDRWRKNS